VGCWAAAVWLLLAGAAPAQTFRTVSEGITVGHFLLYPSVAFEYTYDNNIQYTSQQLPEDQVTQSGIVVIKPRILMDLPIGAGRVRWVYSPLYRNYTSSDFAQANRLSHFFDFEAMRVGPRLTLRAAYHYVRDTLSLREVDPGGEAFFGLEPFTSQVPELEATFAVGARSGLSLIPRYTEVHFDNPSSASFFDYSTKSLEFRFLHSVSNSTEFYAFYSEEDTDQNRENVSTGHVFALSRASGFGLRRSLNQDVVTQAYVGYREMNFTNGGESDFAGIVLDANITLQAGDATVLNLEAVHLPYQSFFVNNNYYVDTEVRVRATHQLSQSVFIETGLGFLDNLYADPLDTTTIPSLRPSEGIRRRDRAYQFEAGTVWQFTRAARLFVGYNSQRRHSNIEELQPTGIIDPFNYRVNRVIVRIEVGWL
jgi:putative beta-barrel porin BBP2